MTGAGASTTSVGIAAGSEARLNFYSGTITGFGIGVQAWNYAIAFVTSICDPIVIRGNVVSGVYVSDGGIAKIFGLSAADATASGCTAAVTVDIGSNGKYGVLVDGGGNANLQLARITGHTLEGVRVQHGSVVRVRSSTVVTVLTYVLSWAVRPG